MIGAIAIILLGLSVMGLTGYGMWWLLSTIFKGIFMNNWLMVIGGGILAYLVAGLLFIGFFAGVAITLMGIEEVLS